MSCIKAKNGGKQLVVSHKYAYTVRDVHTFFLLCSQDMNCPDGIYFIRKHLKQFCLKKTETLKRSSLPGSISEVDSNVNEKRMITDEDISMDVMSRLC